MSYFNFMDDIMVNMVSYAARCHVFLWKLAATTNNEKLKQEIKELLKHAPTDAGRNMVDLL